MEGFYRLVSRVICLQIREDLGNHLEWQFGVALRKGCGVANMGVRLLPESTPSWGVIQVDVKNAFNTIHQRAKGLTYATCSLRSEECATPRGS